MRFLIGVLVVATACTSSPSPEGPVTRSVRDRLAAPTRLLVVAPQSMGSITARRYANGGWQEGSAAIAIDNGELDATVTDSGALSVTKLAVSAQPIDIPSDVFGQPAQLRDVRLAVADMPAFATTWTDDDNATASATVNLELSWSLAVGSTAFPLGTQTLEGIPVDIALTGDGDVVDAAIGAHAEGEVWSWADLVQLANLQLTLAASTAS